MILGTISFGLSVLLTWVLFPFARKFARKVKLIDQPTKERKVHKKPTPVIGGLLVGVSFLFSFGLVSAVAQIFSSFYWMLLGIFTLYLVLGALDDRFDIPAKQKFLIQIICAVLVVNSGVYLESLGTILNWDLPTWVWQAFTVLLIVGAINAYNLVDGIDGLLGSFLTFGFLWLLFISFRLGEVQMSWLFLTVIGSLLVFLKQNFATRKKIFMGDAGSLSLGFLLIVSSIYLFEKGNAVQQEMSWMSIGIIAFLSVPIMDTIIVFARRINKLSSPFKADRTHLHHFVLNLNFSHKAATALIIGFALALFFNSILLFVLGWEVLSFFVLPTLILIFYAVLNKIQLFRNSQRIILSVEKTANTVH